MFLSDASLEKRFKCVPASTVCTLSVVPDPGRAEPGSLQKEGKAEKGANKEKCVQSEKSKLAGFFMLSKNSVSFFRDNIFHVFGDGC